MKRAIAVFALAGLVLLSSCAKKESGEASPPAGGAPAPAQQQAAAQPPAAGAPHASVLLKNGTKVPGTIVASSQTDMVVAGDDGIERKIPLNQIKSVEYGEAHPAEPVAPQPARQQAPPPQPQQRALAPTPPGPPPSTPPPAPAPAPAPAMVTYELPAGTAVSVRTNEAIDSGKAAEGQRFDADITRNVKDADGQVVIPRGAKAFAVIKSASKGGRFRGASDLVLDLRSVVINGRQYAIDTAEIQQKGKAGVGANKRTAKYTGGGAAFGAIIGAIAGGGKGAAIGAGAGAGAGALTQALTKGGAIKVPAETVLTFSLDKPLRVTAEQ